MKTGMVVRLNRGTRRADGSPADGAGDDGSANLKAYRGFFEHAIEGFFQTTPEGQYLRANPALARIYGYESPKALMKALTDISVQLYVDPLRREEFAGLMKGPGEVVGFESEVYRRDGSVIWISENARVVHDEEGKALFYEGTVQDITPRKRAEIDLRTSQKFIERVTQSSPNILYVYDLIQKRYVYANDRIYRILGRTLDELLGMGSDFLTKFLHPDDRWLLEERDVELSEAEDGQVFEYEFRLLHCDGGWRWINARETVFTRVAEGRPHEVIGTAQDISERKATGDALLQSEERFRKLVEGAAAIFWERELGGGRFTYMSPQVEKLFGHPVENWYLPHFWKEHVHELDWERVERFYTDEASRPSGSHAIEYRLRNSDGRLVWVREFGHVTKSGVGGLLLQGFMLDITERHLARVEIRRSQEQLRALSARLQSAREAERTHIAREIHDELGGALTALKMDVSKVLSAYRSSREETARMDFINDRLAGAMALIDRTMESVRRIATELRPAILDELGIVAAIEWQIEEFEKRFGIKCELKNQWSPRLVFDQALSTALFRIFQEMLTNVARHSEATAVSVHLHHDTENLMLCVSDNGRGITERERRNALGLLGMQERAGIFGGKVDIRSAAGKGTVANMRIPMPKIPETVRAPHKERLLPPRR
jgi:PAS domain S-box-containing protein